MEKESYSIDDILSEVKKRRESENREQTNTEVQASAQTQNQKQPEVEKKAEPEFKEVIKEEKPEVKVSVAKDEPKKAEVFIEKKENTVKGDTADIVIPTIEEENDFTDTDEVEDSENVVSNNQEKGEDTQENENNGMVDLLSLADGEVTLPKKEEEPKKEDKVKFSKTKKGKAIISIIVILLVMIIAAGVFAILYANNMLNKVTDDNNGGTDYEMNTYYDGMDFLKEDFPTIEEASAGEVYSYKEYLKQWYQNGDPVSSTPVRTRQLLQALMLIQRKFTSLLFCVTFMFILRLTARDSTAKSTPLLQWAE